MLSKSKKNIETFTKSQKNNKNLKLDNKQIKPQATQEEIMQKEQQKIIRLIKKRTSREKKELKEEIEQMRQHQEYIPEDDGYLDDIFQYEEANWNQLDLRGELASSLAKDQKIKKMASFHIKTSSKKKNLKKNPSSSITQPNYNFERLQDSIDRQNYMKTAKVFDSTLRLDYDEVHTLNTLKKEFNPYPDYTAGIVSKNLRYLTKENPLKSSPFAMKVTGKTLADLDGGRITPKIPRIYSTVQHKE